MLRHWHLLHYVESGLRLFGRHEHAEASFIRDVKWIEPQNFAGTLHRFINGNQRLFQLDADVAVSGYLVRASSQGLRE